MNSDEQRVIVTDVRMPFLSMIVFMVKWAIAAIPAVIILAVLWSTTAALVDRLIGLPTQYI